MGDKKMDAINGLKTISERLDATIKAQEVSYRELEKLTGINYGTIRNYATGETDRVPAEAVKLLAKALHVSPQYLFFGEKTEEDKLLDEEMEKRKDLFELINKMDEEGLDKLIQIAKLL